MATANISPKDVMALRRKTGLGMMDCKAALAEAGGDMAAAEEALKAKLKGKMDGRTDRAAGEGTIAIAIDGDAASIIEIRAETDFTARNEDFVAMAKTISEKALAQPAGDVAFDDEMKAMLDEVRIKTGENISFARGTVLKGGTFGRYVHHDGKLGAVVQFEGDVPADLATGICQHVAAFIPTPSAVDEHGLPAAMVEEKRAEAVAEAKASGKPEEIATKIAEGKMRKFFEEVTLLGQPYVRDDKSSVGSLLPSGTKVLSFVRMQVGETGEE